MDSRAYLGIILPAKKYLFLISVSHTALRIYSIISGVEFAANGQRVVDWMHDCRFRMPQALFANAGERCGLVAGCVVKS